MTSHKKQTTQKWHCKYSRRFVSWWWQFQIKLAQCLSKSIFLRGSSKYSLGSRKSNRALLSSSIMAWNKYSTVGPQLETYNWWCRMNPTLFPRCKKTHLLVRETSLLFNKHRQTLRDFCHTHLRFISQGSTKSSKERS